VGRGVRGRNIFQRVWNWRVPFVMQVGAERIEGDGPSDDELIGRYRATQDAGCFAELFARYRKRIYFACRQFYSEAGAAEDATQDTFLRAYQNLDKYGGGDFCGWLMRIARNVCIDQWRKRKTEGGRDGEADIDQMPARGASDPTSDVTLAAERVIAEMKHLSEPQRRCLAMKIEGYSYEETAMRTGMSVPAVKSHLQNGRRALWLKISGSVAGLKI
jgi:RNA polymerase sigma-70 factor, ECF subfamily